MNAADSDDSSDDDVKQPAVGVVPSPTRSAASQSMQVDSIAAVSVSATSAAQVRSMLGEDSSEDDAPPRAVPSAKQQPKAMAKSLGRLGAVATSALDADEDDDDVEEALANLVSGPGRGRGGGPSALASGRGRGAGGPAAGRGLGSSGSGGVGLGGLDLGMGDSVEEDGVQAFGLSTSALSSPPSRLTAPAKAKAAGSASPQNVGASCSWDDEDDSIGADKFSPSAKAALGLSDEVSGLGAQSQAGAVASPAGKAAAKANPTSPLSAGSDEEFGSDFDLPM